MNLYVALPLLQRHCTHHFVASASLQRMNTLIVCIIILSYLCYGKTMFFYTFTLLFFYYSNRYFVLSLIKRKNVCFYCTRHFCLIFATENARFYLMYPYFALSSLRNKKVLFYYRHRFLPYLCYRDCTLLLYVPLFYIIFARETVCTL